MVLDIDHVLKEVGVGAVSQRAQLTFEELKTLWVTQSKFIEWAVLAGKCVELSGFMTISAGNCTLDKRFCLNCVSIIKPPRDLPEVAFQLVKPNYYAIATRAGLKNVVARTVLKEVFDRLATHLASRKDMRVEFGAIGQLLNGGGRTAFEFSSAFLDQCGHRAAPLASAMAARPKSARPGGGVLVHNNPELNRFIKLCEAADKASAGMLSRAEAERILSRVPALVAGRDALSVLGMLEAASQRSGKLVKYLALASALLETPAAVRPATAPVAAPPPPRPQAGTFLEQQPASESGNAFDERNTAADEDETPRPAPAAAAVFAAAPAQPEWSQEPELARGAKPVAAAAAVATSLEGFSDSRPPAQRGQSRREVEAYNHRLAPRLREELASHGRVTPKVGQSSILLSEVQNTRLNGMGEWLAQQVREKAVQKQEHRRREIALDEARCQTASAQLAREEAAVQQKRLEASTLLRTSWAAQVEEKMRQEALLPKSHRRPMSARRM